MAYDPVLYVIDKQTKQKRLIRLLRYQENPKELEQYFTKIPGEKPFQNPNETYDLAIEVSTGDAMRDAVERGKGNAIRQADETPPVEPELEPAGEATEPEKTEQEPSNDPAGTHPDEKLEPDPNVPNYDGMKMTELREEATKHGIEVPFGMKKADLVEKLKSLPPTQ